EQPLLGTRHRRDEPQRRARRLQRVAASAARQRQHPRQPRAGQSQARRPRCGARRLRQGALAQPEASDHALRARHGQAEEGRRRRRRGRHDRRQGAACRRRRRMGEVRRQVSAMPALRALAAAALALAAGAAHAQDGYGAPPADIAARLAGLVRAYPDFIARIEGGVLVMRDGTKFPIADGRTNKSFNDLLEQPDIDDMFYATYPAGAAPRQPAKNFDPGRVRFEPLFIAMYGDCHKGEVTKRMRAVEWLPQHRGGKVMITTANGIDRALAAVSRDLDKLPDGLIKYLRPTAGTY